MKVRLLGLAVVLVAAAVIVNALAFQQADVTNKMSVSITNTNAALLAFSDAGTLQDADVDADGSGKQLSVSVTGIQDYAKYTFDPAFMITNNSKELNTAVAITGLTLTTPENMVITLSESTVANCSSSLATFDNLPQGGSLCVKMTVDASGGGAADVTDAQMTLTATRK